MLRAERRRNLRRNLKVGLVKYGWSWRRLRKYLKTRRKLSLNKRVGVVNWYFEEEMGRKGISAK